MSRKQTVVLLAGPNGAGKTSFAKEYFGRTGYRMAFVNADEIAREMGGRGSFDRSREIAAGRRMLEQIKNHAQSGTSFMVETTLATRLYARLIPAWRQRGYVVILIYLRLPAVEHSVERVRKRVANGGHDIPPSTIRRRFQLSAEYLERLYKPLVDEWYVFDSLEGDVRLAAFSGDPN